MKAMALAIRRYLPSDLDAVIAIYQSAIREVSARDYSPAQIAAWSHADRDDWAPHRLSRPAWIAEMDGFPAGFTDLEDDGHLDMMFVHARFQGRGVATALLRQVEAAALEAGLSRVFTEASITARPFFLSRGFELIAEQTVECEGQWLTNFRMHKRLARDQNSFI